MQLDHHGVALRKPHGFPIGCRNDHPSSLEDPPLLADEDQSSLQINL